MLSSEVPRSDDGATSGVAVAPPDVPAQLTAAVGPEYATWGRRVVAALLDNAILAGVTWLALGVGFYSPSLTPGWGAAGTDGAAGQAGDPLVLVPTATLVILLVLQAVTGWTPGKLVVGIRVVREETRRPAGLWTTLARWVLHLFDAILLIGYLRPIWHAKRQTFADGIAHTVVVSELPDLPRQPRIAVYSAAVVTCVLGLGYGCVPITSGSAEGLVGEPLCELESPGPALTSGEIKPVASVSIDRDRRMWTVRETRTVRPGATITWTSDPSVRDTDYRVELAVRPGDGEEPVASRSWDIGTGGVDSWTDNAGFTHDRTIAADEDTHEVEVNVTGPNDALDALGTDIWLDVRLVADGEIVASCAGPAAYVVR